MQYYSSPSYDPYQNANPYWARGVQGQSGAVKEMERRHREMLRLSQSRDIDRMMNDVRYLRCRVDELDRKFNAPVALYSTYKEPSVEVVNTTPSWLSRYWHAFIADPIWEMLKRPSIK